MYEQTSEIDWEAVAKQFQSENEGLRDWKRGYDYAQLSHWMVRIPKPAVLEGLRALARSLKGMDPARLYLYTLIVCTIIGTAVECAALFIGERHE